MSREIFFDKEAALTAAALKNSKRGDDRRLKTISFAAVRLGGFPSDKIVNAVSAVDPFHLGILAYLGYNLKILKGNIDG